MSDSFFRIYRYPSDHLKWDKHIEFAYVSEDVSEDLRLKWINALKFLKQELGKGFLKSCGIRHPFYQKVSNKAPWQISELIRFADTLKGLKSIDSNYYKLKGKLHAVKRYQQEGEHFIDIASDFIRCGFHVIFPEEILEQKNPDIEIFHPENNDRIFIEVSKLNESEERILLSKNYYDLWEELLNRPPFVAFSCQQLKVITLEKMPSILSLIQTLKTKATINDQLQFYEDPWISLAVAPFNKLIDLEKWCRLNNRVISLSGSPLDYDEVKRIIKNKKITKEAEQLPKEHMGLIYLPVNSMFFIARSAHLNSTIEELQSEMIKIHNLIGVVLYAYILSPLEEAKLHDNKHLYSRKMLNEILQKNLLFVYNHSCNLTIKKETLDGIYESFH